MKKLGLSALALAGVMAFAGCSCGKNGEYVFHSVEVKDGDETKSYTCEKGEERSTAGDVACLAVAAYAVKYKLEDEKVTITNKVGSVEVATDYDAKVEEKKLYYKVGEKWLEIGELQGGKLSVGGEDFTVIYKK